VLLQLSNRKRGEGVNLSHSHVPLSTSSFRKRNVFEWTFTVTRAGAASDSTNNRRICRFYQSDVNETRSIERMTQRLQARIETQSTGEGQSC
jgi:hypothetical protein